MPETLAQWQAPEFEYSEKSADWYWAMWIIVVSVGVISVIFNDVLLAILLVIGAFALTLFSKRPPRLVHYEINASGVRIGNTLYPYDSLESFGIEELENSTSISAVQARNGMPVKLLIKSHKIFTPLLVIPLRGIHPQEVHDILKKKLIVENLHESVIQKISEFLGF